MSELLLSILEDPPYYSHSGLEWLTLPGAIRGCFRKGDTTGDLTEVEAGVTDTGGTNISSTELADQILCSDGLSDISTIEYYLYT